MQDTSRYRAPRGRCFGPITRIVVGLILVVAAAFKTHELFVMPRVGGLRVEDVLRITLIDGEIALGFCLLAGYWQRWSRLAALICFVLFSIVAAGKLLAGEASCGCFGRVQVHPAVTLTLDMAGIAGLICWRPATGPSILGRNRLAGRMTIVLGLICLVGLPALIVLRPANAAETIAPGVLMSSSGLAVLDPDKWIGQEFPLLPFVEGSTQLDRDKWLVVLHRHDCPQCQKEIGQLRMRLKANPEFLESSQAFLLELPPYQNKGIVTESEEFAHGRLSDAKKWFVETPVFVMIESGKVIRIGGSVTDIE